MSAFEMIGFFVVVFSSAIGLAGILMAAGYGVVIVYWQWRQGVEANRKPVLKIHSISWPPRKGSTKIDELWPK